VFLIEKHSCFNFINDIVQSFEAKINFQTFSQAIKKTPKIMKFGKKKKRSQFATLKIIIAIFFS